MNPDLLTTSDASGSLGFPILPLLVLVPLIGTAVIMAIPKARPELHRLVAIVSAVTVTGLTLWVLAAFDASVPGFQMTSSATWVESLDIKFFVGVDGISLFLLVLTGILFPVALFAAKPEHDEKGYYAWITLLGAGCIGVFVALDLFLFFLAFELTLVPLYFLIAGWGHGRRVYAANKFFLFTMAGSAFMLVSIISLAVLAGAGDGGGVTFDVLKVVGRGELAQNTGRILFIGFAVAFAVKVPLFPFHTWLPDAHTEAPTAGSVDLAGVLLKLGTYGFLRFGLFLFPEAAVWAAPVLIALGVIGIVYGGIVAAMQRNLKRLVAYSSVAHMGFCIVGLFALNVEGIQGSIMQMVNHGLITGALFVLLGYLYQRRHTYEIAELGGLQKVAPIYAATFTFVMLASIGLPGLSGFVGEFLALLGLYLAWPGFAIVAATGAIFAALYLLWAYQRAFHGEPTGDNRRFPEIKLREMLAVAPLLALILALGIYPKPVLERIEPSVERLVEYIEHEVPGFTSPGTQGGSELSPVAVAEGHADESHADEGSES
jgi:NADH-quinone oxidoreductase subunit M